jgi:hypothetical protein
MNIARLAPVLVVALAGCDPGYYLHGTITRTDGAAVAGATVTSVDPCADFLVAPLVSDAEGKIEHDQLGSVDRDCNFVVHAAGFVDAEINAGERCLDSKWWAGCLEVSTASLDEAGRDQHARRRGRHRHLRVCRVVQAAVPVVAGAGRRRWQAHTRHRALGRRTEGLPRRGRGFGRGPSGTGRGGDARTPRAGQGRGDEEHHDADGRPTYAKQT